VTCDESVKGFFCPRKSQIQESKNESIIPFCDLVEDKILVGLTSMNRMNESYGIRDPHQLGRVGPLSVRDSFSQLIPRPKRTFPLEFEFLDF
jgi:hypothetical protein